MRRSILIPVLILLASGLQAQSIVIDGPVRMLALGDSYTIGESVGELERWPYQFAEALRDRGVEVQDPTYIARTGWTTGNLLSAIGGFDFTGRDFNLVSVLIGVNNQYQGLTFSMYEPELRRIVDSALVRVEGDLSRAFMLSIPDYAYTPFGSGLSNVSDELDEYNALNRQVATEYGITYVDITPISREGREEPGLVASDGLHPSARQYGRWVEEILPYLDIRTGDATSAIPSEDLPLLTLYPNPATTQVVLDTGLSLTSIRILDTSGRTLQNAVAETSPVALSLEGIPPGMYSLVADARELTAPLIRKLVIQP
jgi:lysophospholipase L1-like esterase